MLASAITTALRLVSLYSGGKDSTYALYLAQRQGHQVVGLLSVHPREESMMFHVPNVRWTGLQAEALGIPLTTAESGEGEAEELRTLGVALRMAKEGGAQGVVVGAVASRYQADRINAIARDLGMETVAPLWGLNPVEEVRGILDAGFRAIFVAVAAEGFDEAWLGRPLDEAALGDLRRLHHRHGIHISGEGGEYETMVLEGPNFRGHIVVDAALKEWKGQAGVYRIEGAHLEAPAGAWR